MMLRQRWLLVLLLVLLVLLLWWRGRREGCSGGLLIVVVLLLRVVRMRVLARRQRVGRLIRVGRMRVHRSGCMAAG
jgi:hypothetical protein